MSDGCLGYVRGSNKKRLCTEDVDVHGSRKAETAQEMDEASKASRWRLAGDVTASGLASCGLLGVLSMAKPVHAITLATLVVAKACLVRPV